MSTKYTEIGQKSPHIGGIHRSVVSSDDRQVTEVYMLHALARHTHLANVLARYMAITYT